MKPESILHADVLDIIFEYKNKSYGAYSLRKYYSRRLYQALAIVFFATGVFALFLQFEHKKIHPGTADLPAAWVSSMIQIPNEQPKANSQREVTKHIVSQKPGRTTGSKIVVTSQPVINVTSTLQQTAPPSDPAAAGDPTASNVITSSQATVTALPSVSAPAVNKTSPLLHADVMPAYPGGTEALSNFLKRNLRNPEDVPAGEMIRVKISFIVGYDGVLKGFQVTEDGGRSFNEEVIRVLKKMPRWIPGKAYGTEVSVFYSIPVMFMPAE